MVEVTLWGSLASLADGQERISIEAKDIRELFQKLSERYPGLRKSINGDIAVAIDGVIYRDNWSKKIPEDGEVFLMRRLAGG
jgi:molybdopterin converting factor small subunit